MSFLDRSPLLGNMRPVAMIAIVSLRLLFNVEDVRIVFFASAGDVGPSSSRHLGCELDSLLRFAAYDSKASLCDSEFIDRAALTGESLNKCRPRRSVWK